MAPDKIWVKKNNVFKKKGWIAKNGAPDERTYMHLYDNSIVFSEIKPTRDDYYKHWTLPKFFLSSKAFPDLKWEDEPFEAELIIKPVDLAVGNNQPSLPSNLDEVAEEYALDIKAKPFGNLVKEAFKAGAEWMKAHIPLPEDSVADGEHWKPSEEQMNALKYFIKLWEKTDTQLEYTKVFNNVKSLYDGLKKLL